MDPITTSLLIVILITAIYQYLRRMILEEDLQVMKSELEQLIASIEAAKKSGHLNLPVAKSASARIIYREFMKIFLENRLNSRIKKLTDTHLGHKPEIK